jgi:hypothetical protein
MAQDILKDFGADSVTVKKVSATLFDGVKVTEIQIYKQINPREFYRAEISRVDIYGNVLAYLFPRKPIKIERDFFMEAYEKPLELIGDVFVFGVGRSPLRKIELQNASVVFTNRNKAGVSIDGVSVKLEKRGKKITGNLKAQETIIPSVAKIENFTAKLRSNGKQLEIFDASGDIFDGKLNAELSIDLNNFRTVGGNALISGLDLGLFCKESKFSPGRLEGKADFNLEIEQGTAILLDSIKLTGNFLIKELLTVDLALQNISLVKKFAKDLRTIKFTEVKGEFTFLNGRVNFKEIAGKGDTMKFKSVGWFKLDGTLQHSFDGEFTPNFVAGLSRLVRNSFEKTDDGGSRFRCEISGTFHKPRVTVVDKKTMYRRVVKNVFKR